MLAQAQFLIAIEENDVALVRRMLRDDPGLARVQVEKPKLCEAKICHWLYAGDTPLHLAAAGYRTEIVKVLLEHKADPNAAGNHRESAPLHYAADGYLTGPAWNPSDQVLTIQTLLRAGADINAQDKNGATPLHRAVRTRCAAAAKALLENGADPFLQNKPGNTAFHLVVQNTGRGGSGAAPAKQAQIEIIETFLARGLRPSLRNAQGKTVFDSASGEPIRALLR